MVKAGHYGIPFRVRRPARQRHRPVRHPLEHADVRHSNDVNNHKDGIQQFDNHKEGVPRGPVRDTYWLCSMSWGFAKPLLDLDRYCLPINITYNNTTAQSDRGWRPWRLDDVLEGHFWVDFSNAYLTEAAKASQGSRRGHVVLLAESSLATGSGRPASQIDSARGGAPYKQSSCGVMQSMP
ncbi:uncharacterized protein LY79DRAFT_562643 [Colletotrichum navitas]|uniref:Uncharacterized protein n=1 Tax=Colletotrichum navitas TaxID=681940 RepID=A0AAD8PSU5_9PEZI|nr:uncharacterized protein LY79DRAFT_562643 [Colletotrichum navitas]KAK1580030.1 hypothetical protein LY79DRAFT_562643 [Colletotrichum navitas]